MSFDGDFYESDNAASASSTEDRGLVRAVLAHWQYWVLGIVALGIGIGTYVNPTNTALLYFPFFFGGAVLLLWYGVHDIRADDTPYA